MAETTYSGKYSLSNPPPEGSKDVGPFVQALFEAARAERDRLRLPDRWRFSYNLRVGKHFEDRGTVSRSKPRMAFNLVFSYIERTVANLTARTPIAEAKPIGGSPPVRVRANEATGEIEFVKLQPGEVDVESEYMLLNQVIRHWWSETEQQRSLGKSATKMETYAITVEKHGFDHKTGTPITIVKDVFSFFPAPGNWQNLNNAPYIIDAYPHEIGSAQKFWDVKNIDVEDKYEVLGMDREDAKTMSRYGSNNLVGYPRGYTALPGGPGQSGKPGYCMVIECWLRDTKNKHKCADNTMRPYPGGIRVIQITNEGQIVLDDFPNPNINMNVPEEIHAASYGYDHYPFSIGESYHDDQSVWGISGPEQVGDIQLRLDEMLTRLIHYMNLMVWPLLILPKDCGIHRNKINNRAGTILEPVTSMAGNGIRFLQPAQLTNTFWSAYQTFMDMFGRIYAIEDIDRGQAPSNIVAASAISALQERNAVLMRHKIKEMDYLVRERGRWAISGYQQFGILPEIVVVDGEEREFRGFDYIGQKLNFVVESGAAATRTTAQDQELALQLWQMKLIDQKSCIEMIDVPNKREILERMGENQLEMAMNILAQAGYPPEGTQLPNGMVLPPLQEMTQFLMAPQHRPPANVPGKMFSEPSIGENLPGPGAMGDMPEVEGDVNASV